jgi:glyoxylase-like metal-dependent hydrolase (beta-lactamase superfamily II)
MITIQKFIFSPFNENTYVLYDQTGECVIIDPGCYDEHEQSVIQKFISGKHLKPIYLLNTHCHLDHVFGNNFIGKTYGLKSQCHSEDSAVLKRTSESAAGFGLKMEQPADAGNFLTENDKIAFGNSELKIFHTPGHTPGHLIFYNTTEEIAFTGDVLFAGSIGRSDFPGGNHEDLLNSIKTKIYTLPDDTKVFSGHGSETTVGKEKKTNPFVRA